VRSRVIACVPVLLLFLSACGEKSEPEAAPSATLATPATSAPESAKTKAKQGSVGVAAVGGWRCASNSAAQASISGRISSCQKAAAKIVADVIP
jgi:hypothetical protein